MTHHPRQLECEKCVKSKQVCNLDFSKMKVAGEYAGVSIIVLCDKYLERVR